MIVPADENLERALIGDTVSILSGRFEEAGRLVSASDFYSPARQAIWHAAQTLHDGGHRTDQLTVGAELDRCGQGDFRAELATCAIAGGGAWRSYAEGIVRLATTRRLQSVLSVGLTAIDGGVDGYTLLDQMQADLAGIDSPAAAMPDGVIDLDELCRRELTESPWVIPGILRRGWRAMIVAPEGSGKSLLMEQIAICAHHGVDPFSHEAITPVRALIVDVENDESRLQSGVRRVMRGLGENRKGGPIKAWSRPGGIDIRQRRGRSELEAVIADAQPDLVCMGPIYKMYDAKANEPEALVVAELMHVLDDLRSRYGFALILEHHAGHGEGGHLRKMRPYGSSYWLRWPEFGIGLEPDPEPSRPGSLLVKRWRSDRVASQWPDRLDWGRRFPWDGYREYPEHSTEPHEVF